MPTPKPDTSPANVARVLREYADLELADAQDDEYKGYPAAAMCHNRRESELRALADALEREAESAPTWEERVQNAAFAMVEAHPEIVSLLDADALAFVALPAAFPEYAPND